MKLLIHYITIFCFAVLISHSNCTLEIKFFEQKVNHTSFPINPNATNVTSEVFVQRYFENRVVYEEGGPIILFVGGKEPAVLQYIFGGPLLEVAAEHKAALIYLEHRYFGESVPFNGKLSKENLRFLNSDNATADIYHFLNYLNQTDYPKAKVILAGSGYSGALVTRYQNKYRTSNTTRGAWASSPMVESMPDITEYKKMINENLIKYDHACSDKIDAGFKEMLYELTWLNNSDRLEKSFRLCNKLNLNDRNDIMHFFHTISSILEIVSDELQGAMYCRIIKSIEDNIFAISTAIHALTGAESCIDTSYESSLKIYQNEYDKTGKRADLYLACTQLGWFKSAANPFQPFGYLPSFDLFLHLCQQVFDPTLTAKKMQQNSNNFNRIHTAAYTTTITIGENDPYSSVVIKKTSSSSNVQILDNYQHSYEFKWWIYPADPKNNYQINNVKNDIRDFLK